MTTKTTNPAALINEMTIVQRYEHAIYHKPSDRPSVRGRSGKARRYDKWGYTVANLHPADQVALSILDEGAVEDFRRLLDNHQIPVGDAPGILELLLDLAREGQPV